MLAIRLSRVGKKKKPTFRLIVSEKRKDTLGTFLERLGSYNPHTTPATVALNAERVRYWLGKGAEASSVVHNLLVTAKVIEGKKIPRGKAKKTSPEASQTSAPAGQTPQKAETAAETKE